MSDERYIVTRTLENKIAIAKNNDQHEMTITLDVLEMILNLLKEQENKPESWFKNEEDFIGWISAYYSAPGKFVSAENYAKNVGSWKRLFDEIRIAQGDKHKYER